MEPPKPVINIYGSERTILNASFSSLKLECEKLAQEKTEIQRQYIMVSASPSTPKLDQFKQSIIW